ncbi:alkene reductase [Caballeronia sp. dw_276]|uniref:alkene reductase n=1 Tax=Caballeronia sp. dw_276 TaxID=2719795 RepID=UPI001BD3F71A|nr:alkene reductase [Caballeronia sp. dw_276]
MSQTAANPLFSSFDLGGRMLTNRIVMAPMTRGRARNAGLVPTDLHVEYYRQRASAGLILTEATWVSPEGIGFINVPGLFTPEQVAGWRAVTDAVHAAGGTIFAQLAHSGSVSHPDFFSGEQPLAPSAINPRLRSFTAEGFKATVTPRAMSKDDITRTIDAYRAAARNARSAGFDGVEVHAGTFYLLPQFLNSVLNIRDDAYGGSVENRARIVLEIMEALVGDWSPGRVGVKISPTMAMGGFAPTGKTIATYDYLVARLNDLPLSHLQVVQALNDLAGTPVAALQDTIRYFRQRFEGALIANFGFDKASASRAIESGHADLVSFGKAFIGNPDLVKRLREDLPLRESAPETYYQGDARGYTDYPEAARGS